MPGQGATETKRGGAWRRQAAMAAVVMGMAAPIAVSASSAWAKTLTIGTGSNRGVYIQLGKAICDIVKREMRGYGCKAETSKGSINNLIGLKKGTFDLGIVQSDIQYHAVNGTGTFANIGALQGIYSLFSAHPESLAIVTKKDSGIRTIDELKGRRIDIGKVKSGTNATMRLLFEAMGLPLSSFPLVANLDIKDQYEGICKRKVDTSAFLAGHPNSNVRKLIQLCDIDFVQIRGRPSIVCSPPIPITCGR